VIYAQSWTCESLRKGVFIAGAVFVVFTMILNIYYYMYFAKATSQAARKTNRASSTVGMAGYAWTRSCWILVTVVFVALNQIDISVFGCVV